MAKPKKAAVKQDVPKVLVRATGNGLYDQFRQAGDEFYISGDVYLEGDTIPDHREVGDVKAFSDRWMELAKPPKAEPVEHAPAHHGHTGR